MTIIAITLLVGSIIILNIIMGFMKNRKKRLISLIISTAVSIATIIVTYLSIPIAKPIVLPLDGMLTEDYPFVEFKYPNFLNIFGAVYVSSNPHGEPVDDGSKCSEGRAVLDTGTYYAQTTFLNRRSEIVQFDVISYEESHKSLGDQTGLEDDMMRAIYDYRNIDWNSQGVSMEKTVDINNPPEGISIGWGDSGGFRTSYTLEEINEQRLYDQIIFNTISDSALGNEKFFLNARKRNDPASMWETGLLNVEIGQEYEIRLYGHNNNPKGYDSVAENVEIQFQIPSETGRTVVATGMISSSNASPFMYWDSLGLTCDQAFHCEYQPGSAVFFNNGIGKNGDYCLPDEVVGNWIRVGYDQMDGRIPGCYKYSFYATIVVKVVAD